MCAQNFTAAERAWDCLKSAHDDLDKCKQKLEQAEMQIKMILNPLKLEVSNEK